MLARRESFDDRQVATGLLGPRVPRRLATRVGPHLHGPRGIRGERAERRGERRDIAPGHVIVSDLKFVGDVIDKVYKTVVDGTYKAGVTIDANLKFGGVGISFQATKEVLSKAEQQKVLDLEKQIMDGTLVVGRYQGQ